MRFKDLVPTKADHELMQMPRHALHALTLKINYPSRQEPSLFQTEIPEDFIEWMKVNLSHVKLADLKAKIQLQILP